MAIHEYFHPSDGSDYYGGSLTNKSQSFVAESSYTIDEVVVKLKCTYDPPHTLYKVRLYDTTVTGLPTLAPYVTFGQFYIDELLSTSYAEYSFGDASQAIIQDNEYALVISTDDEDVTTSNLVWYTSATQQYNTGTAGKHNYILLWQALSVNNDRWFELYDSTGVPTKPTNPSPADAATEEDWSARGLSWDDGGGADTYKVWFGLTGSLGLISIAQAGTSITVDADDVPYPEEEESGAVFYWRVDATNDEGTVTGDEWTFDARPAKATVPSPTNTATDAVLGLTTTWTGGATATSYNVLADVGDGLASQDTALEDATWTPSPTIFDYITEYTWRVDSINVYGITTGDEWTFTTIRLTPPAVTEWYSTGGYYYRLLPQSDGSLGDPPGTGVEDTDYEVLDGYLPNFINTYRRLVAVAENKFWYEDV